MTSSAKTGQIFTNEEGRRWVEANRQSLIRDFAGEVVSVIEGKVVAHCRTVTDLLRTVREKGVDPKETYIARMPISRRL